MSLYVGYYYGTFLNSYDFLTAEEIEGFYNGESFEIIQDLENKKISMVSTENEPFFIIGKQVNSDSFYDVFYSGLVQDFDINKFLNLNKEESEKELIEKLKNLNEILKKHNRKTIDLDLINFKFFSHTIS